MAGSGVAGVLFDWDGVILDSLGAAFNVYNRIFARIGSRHLSKDEFLKLQSPNWYDFYAKVGIPRERWNEIDSEWVRLYREERPVLHVDARPCLSQLRGAGFRLAVVSNGSKARVEEEVVRFGLVGYFDSVLCGEKQEELKPSPALIERTLARLGMGPSEVVYVGDSPADIQAAKNARVPAIGLARGPVQVGRLGAEMPDLIFGGLGEVARFLLGGQSNP